MLLLLRGKCLASGLDGMELEQSCASAAQRWTDIDAMDHEDPMACTEYVHDIVRHLLEAEVKSAHAADAVSKLSTAKLIL